MIKVLVGPSVIHGPTNPCSNQYCIGEKKNVLGIIDRS